MNRSGLGKRAERIQVETKLCSHQVLVSENGSWEKWYLLDRRYHNGKEQQEQIFLPESLVGVATGSPR